MSKLTTYKDESMVDVTTRGYNHIEGLVSFCRDNGVALDFEETSAVERLVDDVLKQELKSNRPLFPVPVQVKRQSNVVNSDQNIVDLSVQETGSVEGLVNLLKENGFDFTTEPVAGNTIKVKTEQIVNVDVVNFYRASNYKVNTGVFLDNLILLETGVYMITEDDAAMILETEL